MRLIKGVDGLAEEGVKTNERRKVFFKFFKRFYF